MGKHLRTSLILAVVLILFVALALCFTGGDEKRTAQLLLLPVLGVAGYQWWKST